MERYIGRIWVALLVVALGVVVVVQGDSLAAAVVAAGERPFLTALIAGGSATIHELMALIDDLLRASRKRARP